MARPIKNSPFDISISLYKSSGELISNPGIIIGKISKDFGEWQDIGTITNDDTLYSQIKLSLTAAEMNADTIDFYIVDDTEDCVPYRFTIYTEQSFDQLVDLIWDEILTGATHNIPTSAGRRLRQIAGSVVFDGIASGAGVNGNQIILSSDASSVNGAYDPAIIAIVDGSGAGQCRLILEYNGSTRTATVDRDWKVLPDGTSSYVIFADAGREHINEGLIVAASETAVTLNAAASDIDGAYVGQRIFIRSGYGQDQMRRVASYDGSTHIATVEVAWDEIPDSTSAYVMLPTGAISNTEIGTAVWEHSGRSIDSIDLNIYETGYLIVGQGLGTTHYTNTISFGPNRNKEGFQVKAYKTTDGLTDFSVIVAMDITDSLGAFDLWLDPSYYVLRVEKNGASIDSAIILVE